ncbi:MAG: pyruvate kinase [Maritimibacter sp.]|nr:pyruvate kinase [Maritimibacter sp.]
MNIREMLAGPVEAQALAVALLDRLTEVRAEALAEAERTLAGWRPHVRREGFLPSVENLALYLALRKLDLTAEQAALTELGLSSLGRAESHVLATLDAVIGALAALAGRSPGTGSVSRRFDRAARRIERRRDAIFGADPQGPSTRILVTLPTEAADDPAVVAGLVAAGAAAVRINCAHDGPAAWAAMIDHVRAAAAAAGRRVPVYMDLAGPKVRTRAVSCPRAWAKREKKKIRKSLKHPLSPPAGFGPRLLRGDRLALCDALRGDLAQVEVVLSHPALLGALKPGAMVHFDDGKLGARVLRVVPGRAELEVTHVRDKGARLRPEKGVNLPGVEIDIPALTEADLAALDFAVGRADIIGYSFVQTARDVRAIHTEIAARLPEGAEMPALVLKVETDLALHNLPRLIVQAGALAPVAVMIARGDLAVEIGLERLSEVQEEILWLCEAAEVPVIWATQVLENLAKDGFATRAEATDAAMAQRAECVMLNKGPYTEEAIAFLRKVGLRMDRHQSKKTPRLGPLRAWTAPQGL